MKRFGDINKNQITPIKKIGALNKKISGYLIFALIINFSIFYNYSIGLSQTPAKNKADSKVASIFNEKDFAPTNSKEIGEQRIYNEIILEDFESNNYTNKNLRFQYTRMTSAGIIMRQEYPAPIFESKKYIGLKVFGRKGDTVSLIPIKPIIIDKFCKSLNIWVYGKGLSGSLSVLLTDSNKNTHHLYFGQLRFLGWRRLSVSIPATVDQQDQFLNQKNNLKIISMVYNPGNSAGGHKWNYFYLDDFTATVREKYTDKQADNW